MRKDRKQIQEAVIESDKKSISNKVKAWQALLTDAGLNVKVSGIDNRLAFDGDVGDCLKVAIVVRNVNKNYGTSFETCS